MKLLGHKREATPPAYMERLIDEIAEFGFLTLFQSEYSKEWSANARVRCGHIQTIVRAKRDDYATALEALEGLVEVIRSL